MSRCKTDFCDREAVSQGYCRKCYKREKRKGTIINVEIKNTGSCIKEGCNRPQYSKGLCEPHYRQIQRANNPTKCSVEGCDKPNVANGLCRKHYSRVYSGRGLQDPVKEQKLCSVEGCGGKHQAKGFCLKHYTRFLEHGDPNIVLPIKNTIPCEFPGCKYKVKVSGLCSYHKRRKLKLGYPESTVGSNKNLLCSVEGCQKPSHAKGLCVLHYRRFLVHGDPNICLKQSNAGLCSMCGERKAETKGRCGRCYHKWKSSWDEGYRLRKGLKNNRRRAARISVPSEKYTREQVLEKTGGKCGICGKDIDLSLKYPNTLCFTYDHVVPISKGGSNLLENMQPAHFSCNSSKSNRTG